MTILHMPPVRFSIESLRKILPPAHDGELGLPEKGEVELSKLETNTWLLTLPNAQKGLLETTSALNILPIHQKVLRLLKTHRLPDLIEGRFERFLSGEELSAFQELLHAGKVIVVKSNPKFDKGIYREHSSMLASFKTNTPSPLPPSPLPSVKKVITQTMVVEKPIEEYTLHNDGFMIIRSDGAAKAASFDLQDRIKAGEIKGIKSFDGFYYIIENALLEKYTSPVLVALKEKKKDELSTLALSQAIPPILARIVLEFAKEDGLVIEKHKNFYAYVG